MTIPRSNSELQTQMRWCKNDIVDGQAGITEFRGLFPPIPNPSIRLIDQFCARIRRTIPAFTYLTEIADTIEYRTVAGLLEALCPTIISKCYDLPCSSQMSTLWSTEHEAKICIVRPKACPLSIKDDKRIPYRSDDRCVHLPASPADKHQRNCRDATFAWWPAEKERERERDVYQGNVYIMHARMYVCIPYERERKRQDVQRRDER